MTAGRRSPSTSSGFRPELIEGRNNPFGEELDHYLSAMGACLDKKVAPANRPNLPPSEEKKNFIVGCTKIGRL